MNKLFSTYTLGTHERHHMHLRKNILKYRAKYYMSAKKYPLIKNYNSSILKKGLSVFITRLRFSRLVFVYTIHISFIPHQNQTSSPSRPQNLQTESSIHLRMWKRKTEAQDTYAGIKISGFLEVPAATTRSAWRRWTKGV